MALSGAKLLTSPRLAWRRLRSSPVLTYAVSTVVSQASSIVIAPLLARLYSPAAFGAYATFYALAAIAGTVVGLALNNAILLEDDDESAFRTALSALIVPAVLSCGFLLLLVIVPDGVLHRFFPSIEPELLYLLPFTVLSAVAFQIGYTCLLRMGRYRVLSVNRVFLAAVTSILQVSIGWLRLGALGLIIANLAGYICAGMAIWRSVLRENSPATVRLTLSATRAMYKKHRKFPLYTMPAQLVNNTANYIPDILIGRLFGASVLGQYSLGMRTVGMPLAFITTTAQDVFRREASLEYVSEHGCARSFRKWFTIMVVTAIGLLVPVLFAVSWLLPRVFGSEWSDSAAYVQAVAGLLIVRYISSPLSYVWIITGRQQLDLYWQLGLLFIAATSLLVPSWLWPDMSAVTRLAIFGCATAAWYAFALLLSYRWSRTPQCLAADLDARAQ